MSEEQVDQINRSGIFEWCNVNQCQNSSDNLPSDSEDEKLACVISLKETVFQEIGK